MTIRPYLEHKNMFYPRDFFDMFFNIIIEYGLKYPLEVPIISFYCNEK